MASESGPDARALSLLAALEQHPDGFDLFQALRRVECAFPDRPRLGEALHAAEEPVRLAQEPSLAFAVSVIAALEHTALYGAVLAVLVILLFLHAWRSTLIVAVSLPVSVLGTIFATYAFHQSLNTMTLGGLALAVGLIVDDAVVVIENIFRHLDEGETARQARSTNSPRAKLSPPFCPTSWSKAATGPTTKSSAGTRSKPPAEKSSRSRSYPGIPQLKF